VQGAKAYREFVAHTFDDPHPLLFVRTPDRIDVGAPEGAPVAAETGRWVGSSTDSSKVRTTGRYLVRWTKRTGEWRIVSETYVTVDLDGPGDNGSQTGRHG
jgi:ketosteroid isomerase-like protein